jgi:hypothetical protein
MVNPDSLPDTVTELLELRSAVDAKLMEKRNAMRAEADRVDGVIANGKEKKRRGRKPKDEAAE